MLSEGRRRHRRMVIHQHEVRVIRQPAQREHHHHQHEHAHDLRYQHVHTNLINKAYKADLKDNVLLHIKKQYLFEALLSPVHVFTN